MWIDCVYVYLCVCVYTRKVLSKYLMGRDGNVSSATRVTSMKRSEPTEPAEASGQLDS